MMIETAAETDDLAAVVSEGAGSRSVGEFRLMPGASIDQHVFENWESVTGGQPDNSDRNIIRNNTITDTTSESIDIKEGTTGGALDNLLTAGTKALEGNGELGSRTIRNLSEAAETFARNRGPLFDNVRSLAEITDTLAANDKTVEAFLESLTSVSGQLEGERDRVQSLGAVGLGRKLISTRLDDHRIERDGFQADDAIYRRSARRRDPYLGFPVCVVFDGRAQAIGFTRR